MQTKLNDSSFQLLRSLPTCAFLLPSFLSCFGHDLLPPPIVLFFLFFLFHSPLHCSDYSDDKYRRGAARPKLRSPQLPAPSRVLIFRGDNEDPRAHSFESSFSFIKFSLAESRGTPLASVPQGREIHAPRRNLDARSERIFEFPTGFLPLSLSSSSSSSFPLPPNEEGAIFDSSEKEKESA